MHTDYTKDGRGLGPCICGGCKNCLRAQGYTEEISEPELMDALLRDLWRKHAGTDPTPFLRFAAAMEKEGDFLEFFREGYERELRVLRRQHQERDDDGDRADYEYESRRDREMEDR